MAAALEVNLTPGDFIAGDTIVLAFEVLASSTDPANPKGSMADVTDWDFDWTMRKALRRIDPHRQRASGPPLMQKTSDSGITVAGQYNPDRSLNQQRVFVLIPSTDSAKATGDLHTHVLKGAPPNPAPGEARKTLAFGTIPVLVLATD